VILPCGKHKAHLLVFIWKGGIPKVAKAMLRLPKNEGGLSVWSLVDKARAFTSMWVVKYLQNMTNPVLQSNIQVATNWYASAKGITVPIWELCIDHSYDMKKAGFSLLAMLQRSWATVVRHDPRILQGDWMAYRDYSTHKQLCKDVLYERRAKILEVGCSPKDSATAEWYEPDPIMGVMTYTPLDNGEVWHLEGLHPCLYSFEGQFPSQCNTCMVLCD
jgi:hypothetical protein